MKAVAPYIAAIAIVALSDGAGAYTPVSCGFPKGDPETARALAMLAETESVGSVSQTSDDAAANRDFGRDIGNGRSAYFLAERYALGLGVEQDLQRSRTLYLYAAERTEGPMSKSAACFAAGIGRLIVARGQQTQPTR